MPKLVAQQMAMEVGFQESAAMEVGFQESCAMEVGIEKSKRAVTTLMLHGIPARKKMHLLFPIFEELGFSMESFDFFYMPHRCSERRGAVGNFGYMFLNCTTPEIAQAFALAIHHHPLGRTQDSCEKVYCAPADVQGRDANLKKACMTGGDVKNFALVRTEGSEWQAVHRASRTASVCGGA